METIVRESILAIGGLILIMIGIGGMTKDNDRKLKEKVPMMDRDV